MPFLTELEVRVADEGNYVLTADLVYQDHRKRKIRVPTNFVTDFASVPRIFRWLVTGHDGTRKPAVVHDYLVRGKYFKREEADKVFLHAMKEAGVPGWKRVLCYSAVAAFTLISGDD